MVFKIINKNGEEITETVVASIKDNGACTSTVVNIECYSKTLMSIDSDEVKDIFAKQINNIVNSLPFGINKFNNGPSIDILCYTVESILRTIVSTLNLLGVNVSLSTFESRAV